MILNNNTTSMGLRPTWESHIFVRSASSKGVRNTSNSTNNDNCYNVLHISERASIENFSSNSLSLWECDMWYIFPAFCSDYTILVANLVPNMI